MKGTVKSDHTLTDGGPVGPRKFIATFRKGEVITLVRVSPDGDYPAMYTIAEHPEAGEISWRIVDGLVFYLT